MATAQLRFAKQPIRSNSPASESDHAHPSLLSTMLRSPSNQTGKSGSTPPSSPQPHSDAQSVSILRRNSFSSDGEGLGQTPEKLPSVQRHTSLKFAVAPLRSPPPRHVEEEVDSDDGYKEDEEDSDGEEDKPNFAKPTNWRRKRQRPSPPPAPAVVPPPPRRGRGHITVAEGTSEGEARCSRHRSPPPVSSRSPSRHSDAGPRRGRAGSPMPAVDSDDSST
jgi:hypothetical protein